MPSALDLLIWLQLAATSMFIFGLPQLNTPNFLAWKFINNNEFYIYSTIKINLNLHFCEECEPCLKIVEYSDVQSVWQPVDW